MILRRLTEHPKFIVLTVVILTSLGFLAIYGLPRLLPSAPEQFDGFCYAPSSPDYNPLREQYPPLDEIAKDMRLMAEHTDSIRLYSSIGISTEIFELARENDLYVTAGAWLDGEESSDEQEIKSLIAQAERHSNINRVIMGNEAILRGDLEVPDMITALKRVDKEVEQPVSTAEPWHVWMENPELAENVDFLMIHILPYWEGIPATKAVDYLFKRLEELREQYPEKPIVIGEVGWPSDGPAFEGADTGREQQRIFLHEFVAGAESKGVEYFIMEAFDQAWKVELKEGEVGAHWGILDRQGNLKTETDDFSRLTLGVDFWGWLIAALGGLFITGIVLRFRPPFKVRGLCVFVLFIQISFHSIGAVVAELSFWPVNKFLINSLLLIALILLIGHVFCGLWEMIELLWRSSWKQSGLSEKNSSSPRVSIHVPVSNEPPHLVLECLQSLSQLDYPNYEVLVISNNTTDEKLWRPLEEFCQKEGEPFRFFHIDNLSGYKAGALNYALFGTDPDAEIIGVIDSDYILNPDWLKYTVPYFSQKKVAVVQLPQEHRLKKNANLFQRMCYWEYRGFFHLGMMQRNERNAIIQHGTMSMIRKSAIEECGGWATWCICEDAELGLRLLEQGYQAIYIPEIMGRGILPANFTVYKKQRTRWAYGAARIVCRHAAALFLGRRTKPTRMQRLHFIAGWVPWFGDALHVLFSFAITGWSIGMLLLPEKFAVFSVVLLVPILTASLFLLVRSIVLYSYKVPCTPRDRWIAICAGLALVPTIGMAMIQGIFRSGRPFLRTLKTQSNQAVFPALHAAKVELCFFTLLSVVFILLLIFTPHQGVAFWLWCTVILVQSIPYLAAVVMSAISMSRK